MFLYNIFLLKVMQCHRQCFLSFSYKLALTRLYISVCSIGWQGLDGGRTQYTLELCKGAPPLIFGVSALLFPTAITKCRKMWRDRLEVVCRRAAVGVEMKPGPWGERRWDRFFFFPSYARGDKKKHTHKMQMKHVCKSRCVQAFTHQQGLYLLLYPFAPSCDLDRSQEYARETDGNHTSGPRGSIAPDEHEQW